MQLHPSTDVVALREGIEADLAQLASPLMQRLATVDSLIAERVDDLATLRKVRLDIVKAVRPFVGEDAIPVEPGRSAKPGPKPKPKPRGSGTRVGQERLDLALRWMREQTNGNGFTSREMREAFPHFSRTSAEAVVRVLREREQIRVSSPHRGPSHPARYKVVS